MVDLAGYTALTEAHGDENAADLAVRFAELAVGEMGPGDRLVKTIGDAVLLASRGPDEGFGLVERLLRRCAATALFPIARAGLHHGPAVARGDDIFGTSVNLTARIAGEAAGGQVLATAEVAQAAERRGFPVSSTGSAALRNLADPVELFDIDIDLGRQRGGVDPVRCRTPPAR